MRYSWATATGSKGSGEEQITLKALFKLWIMENVGKNQFSCINRCLSSRRGRAGKTSNQSITSKWQHEKSMLSKNKCTWEITKKREKTWWKICILFIKQPLLPFPTSSVLWRNLTAVAGESSGIGKASDICMVNCVRVFFETCVFLLINVHAK